ncbi:MAG: hypothetical protein WD273_08270 [Trueperaceae bacterium]
MLGVVVLTIIINAVQFEASGLAAHLPNLILCAVIGAALWLNQLYRLRLALAIIIVLVLLAASYPLLAMGVDGNETPRPSFFSSSRL